MSVHSKLKSVACMSLLLWAGNTGGVWGGGMEKIKNFKTETIKRLSPMSKCHCFNHSRAFRTQKFLLLPNHGD